MNIYASLSLSPVRREIRLLHLSPGRGEDPIEAHLYRASLDAKPTYSVLSYAWGPDADPVTIQVQGEDFPLTRNLYQCLIRLRHEKEPLIIWVDAICIDQKSNQEKNTQVPLMKDIYLQAQQLFIWLGVTTNVLELIFASVRIVSSYGEDFKYQHLKGIGDGLNASPEEILAAFSEFSSLAWWRRTWIIQEFALPRRDPMFVCGTHRVPCKALARWWEVIRDANSTIRQHDKFSQMNPSWGKLHGIIFTHPLPHLIFVRYLFSDPKQLQQGLPLSALINISEVSIATNARDKIYGILGLADSNARSKIRVDYGQSVESLYEEVSRYLICEEKKLNVLSNQSRDIDWKVGSAEDGSMQQVSPCSEAGGHRVKSSWIRDFAHLSSPIKPLLGNWHPRRAFYDASCGTAPLVVPDQRPKELGICGLEVGIVEECAKAWHTVPGKMQYFNTWDAILPVFFNAAQPREDSKLGEEDHAQDNLMNPGNFDWDALYHPTCGATKTMRETIWRCVIGDRLQPGNTSAPAFCGTFFSGLMQAYFNDATPSISLSGAEGVTSLEEGLELFSTFKTRIDDMLYRKSAFRTVDGWIGLAPDHVQKGDVIVILSGGDVPFVLRPWDDGWRLVGECYVEGVMDGQMIQGHVEAGSVPGKLYRIR